DVIAQEVKARHDRAFPDRQVNGHTLDAGGQYQYRREGEYHLFNLETVPKLYNASRSNNYLIFKKYSTLINGRSKHFCTLHVVFGQKFADNASPIEEV